jgi:hypothetical protein
MSNNNATRTAKSKTSLLTSTYANGLDKHDTLSCDPTRGSQAQARGCAFGHSYIKLPFVILIIIVLLSINTSGAYAYKNHSMNLKLYAHNEIKNWKQFECYNRLIFKESSWNYKARNGSHYGLGQMRSTWYGTLTPRKQIKAHLRYIEHRYSTPCKAERHFNRVGWH